MTGRKTKANQEKRKEFIRSLGPSRKPNDPITCAACGISYIPTDLELLSDAMLNYKPACSYECNKKLGQVK